HELLLQPEQLVRMVREFATPRYREGYEKGIHDHDAALILNQLIPLRDSAGLLAFSPLARALGLLFISTRGDLSAQRQWPQRARAAAHSRGRSGRRDGSARRRAEGQQHLADHVQQLAMEQGPLAEAAEYLLAELAGGNQPVMSKYARRLT